MLTGKNDAITTLAAEIAAGASSCTVTDASKLPATFPYRLRIWDWATYRQPADDAGEIVEVTNAVGNVLTITRAQEGTADVLHAAGETCANTITWAYVDEMQSAIAARALAGAVTASGLTMATGKILGRATASTGAIEEIAVTGTGSVVLATSPTLTTPELGEAHATSLTCSSFMGTYSSGGAAQVTARAWTNTAAESGYISFYRRRGTEASPLDVLDGDRMGRIVWFGYDTGGTLRTVNAITAECQGGPTGSGVPSRMMFGPSSSSPRMAIYNDASIVLGTQSALATNATGGFVYIPTCAGAPTGTPTSYTGKVALVYDTSNNRLYVYNGAWKYAAMS